MNTKTPAERAIAIGFCIFLCAIFCGTAIVCFGDSAQAQRRPAKKNVILPIDRLETTTYDFHLGASVDKLVNDGTNTDIYDEYQIENLKRLKERAQPDRSPDDIDPSDTRRVVEQAFAIQSGNTVVNAVRRSELRNFYYSVKRSLTSIQDTFRYSVQRGGDGFEVTKRNKGKKLLEFGVEFNSKTVLDPQLKIGDAVRFRYDFEESTPKLEYHQRF